MTQRNQLQREQRLSLLAVLLMGGLCTAAGIVFLAREGYSTADESAALELIVALAFAFCSGCVLGIPSTPFVLGGLIRTRLWFSVPAVYGTGLLIVIV